MSEDNSGEEQGFKQHVEVGYDTTMTTFAKSSGADSFSVIINPMNLNKSQKSRVMYKLQTV